MANCTKCGKELPEGQFGICPDCVNREMASGKMKGTKINVTVDPEPLENAMRKQAEAEAREAEVSEKLEAVMDKQANKLLDEYGVTDEAKRFELRANPEALEAYIQGLKDAQKQNQKEVTGQLTWDKESAYHQSREHKAGYDSQAEMIEDLQSRARQGDKNSEKILGQLLVKSLKGVAENKKGFGKIETPIDGETEIQRLNRIWREKQLRNRNRD